MIKVFRFNTKPAHHIVMMSQVLAMFLIMVIAYVAFSPTVVKAQEYDPTVIDLVLGGDGATPWNIVDKKPCANGIKTVTLHNAGSANGTVTIWISDIVSEEGLNPESETDDIEEPGELDKYLLLDLSASAGMDTNVSNMPTTIYKFPLSADDTNYIYINPLNSDDTITLTWSWEIPCATGNEAQGDRLSFTINYALIEIPQPPPTTRAAGPILGGRCFLDINILGKLTTMRIDCCNNSTFNPYIVYDPYNTNLLDIDRGTPMFCGDCVGCGSYPDLIAMSINEDPPQPSEGMVILSPVYELTGYRNARDPEPCSTITFGKPVVLLLNYDPNELPENTLGVFIAYYNEEDEQWVGLSPDTGRVAQVGVATGLITRLSSFAVIARIGESQMPELPTSTPKPSPVGPQTPELEPADFIVSDLSIIPSERFVGIGTVPFMIERGYRATVVATAANNGGQVGNYSVLLMLNGIKHSEMMITLSPGELRELVFTLSNNEPGDNNIQIGNLSKDFVTERWYNWPLIAGFLTASGFLIWAIWYKMHRRRRQLA